MKSKFLLSAVVAATALMATQTRAQLPPGAVLPKPSEPAAISLWQGLPNATSDSEVWFQTAGDRFVRNVTQPTITPYLPEKGKATGSAAIVAPGGAFMALAIDHEGVGVARWLAAHGIAAFVLKYRLLTTPVDQQAAEQEMQRRVMESMRNPSQAPTIENPDAAADALRAIAVVRGEAARWGIDPRRVGIIGFSAGAMTALQAGIASEPEARPSFVGYIYGPQNAVSVPAHAPPLFDALAWDDQLFRTNGFALAEEWKKSRTPIELHAYQSGGHGFGIGLAGTTSTEVLPQFELWLRTNGLLGQAKLAERR